MASGGNYNNNGYDASFSYSSGYTTNPSAGVNYYGANVVDTTQQPHPSAATLRRRNAEYNGDDGSPYNYTSSPKSAHKTNVVKKLDFMFPKVDTEYTVRTDRGGMTSLIAYGLIAIFALAEITSWISQNYSYNAVEHITVDTSLGKKMRVNLDVTFPALACEDLHIDIMDVAGDSQLDIEDTMVKKRLNRKGIPMGKEEIVESNVHKTKQDEKDRILKADVPVDYCGPCYGAHEKEDQCCNTCDELIEAYRAKRWRVDLVTMTSEQCIREGRDKIEPKRLRKGEGCNLSGHFMVNRVGGNFHIAMGEGIERDGRHIHTFNPEDTHNFNASHIINHLSFGPEPEGRQKSSSSSSDVSVLNGVTKIVTKEYGTTGLFQYFIKVVPTIYKQAGKRGRDIETNRFFYTERFRPLMKEYYDDDDNPALLAENEEDGDETKKDDSYGKSRSVHAGHVGGHTHHDHHNVKKNSVLPGVFFIYEIYPFEVEISTTSVPLTHLLIRLMATIGGVFTIMRWADSFLYSRERRH